jgi:hypothetical protein
MQNIKDRQFLYYNAEQDFYICPMGQRMNPIQQKQTQTQQVTIYEAQRCYGCPLRGVCHSAQGNRRIERNQRLEQHKEVVRERLLSEIGIEKRKRRSIEVEPVFGHIKSNRGFKRFTMRGHRLTDLEFGLHAIAHNMLKMAD